MTRVVLKPSKTLWSSWVQNPLCGPLLSPDFLRLGFSLHDHDRPWVSKGRLKQLLIREERGGRERKERSSQEIVIQPWDRILVLSQKIHITISLSSSTELKLPRKEGCWLLDEAFSIPERRSQFENLDNHRNSSGDQIKGCKPRTYSGPYQQAGPWIIAIKFLTIFLWVGTHSCEGMSPLCPPLPNKAIKPFFVLFSHPVRSDSLWPHGLQSSTPPCPSPSPGVCPSSFPLQWWCYLAISSSDALSSFSLQSFPASGTFPMSQFFALGSQNTGASASASVLSTSIQGRFPLRLTGLISFLPKGLCRVFSSTTVWRDQFSGILPSLWPSTHKHTWPLGRT